jgi:glutamate N-acetyltransferase/amino-acid N-acetyltransferase
MLSRAKSAAASTLTVDSDTSTSDTVLLFATGAKAKRGVLPIAPWTIRAWTPCARRSAT